MKVIDLSHEINEEMQIYPGDPKPAIETCFTHEKDGYHVDRLVLGSHTGTHIDAPYHFDEKGEWIDRIPADRCIGLGHLVDVTGKQPEETIEVGDVESMLQDMESGSFVIFRTGWDRYFGSQAYLSHPYLTPELAQWLVEKGVGIVAIDAPNVDPTLQNTYPAHETLMKHKVLIVENLCNLHSVNKPVGIYSFLPLKIHGTDGSPIRAVFMDF